MENIFKLASILSVTGEDIQTALKKEWRDFEDCVQYTVAWNNQMDYIITSNTKDFEGAQGRIMLPEQWMAMFAE